MAHPDPVLDAAFLDRQTFGDRALARDLLRLFQVQAERLLPDLGRATSDHQTATAHLLRGSCQGIGATEAAAILQRFETAEAGARHRLLPALAAAFAALETAIAAHLATAP